MHSWDDDRIYQRACLGLARKGFDVHLIATRPQELPAGSPVHFHWLEYRTGWRRRWKSGREAIELAIAVDADIYHFHDPDLLPHIGRLKKEVPNAKVFYDIHENYAGRIEMWGWPRIFGKLFRTYEISVINRIDGFSVVSESMLSLFSAANVPSFIVRNSTDIERLRHIDLSSATPYDIPTIYTSGTHSHARQCIESVSALKYVKSEVAKFRKLFVGRYVGEIKDELRRQAANDGISDFLHLEDMLPWEENFVRTAKAFCGCVFYEDNPNNRVGVPNRLFEYMFCGIPVVVSDFPELRRVVEKSGCGVVVDSTNPKSIADGFLALLKNPLEAREMGLRGREALEREFGFHVDLEKMIQAYQVA